MPEQDDALDPQSPSPVDISQPERPDGTRMRWLLSHKPLLIGAAAVLVAALAGTTWAVVDSRKLTVPDLVGLAVPDVAAHLDGLDLDPQSAGELPSAGLLDFAVVTGQSPQAGERVFPGHTLEFTFELADVQVPDLTGKTLSAAVKGLSTAGLTGEATYGIVVVLAEGQDGVGVRSTTDSEAIEAAVHASGMTGEVDPTGKPFVLTTEADDTWLVVKSEPAAAQEAPAGSTLELTVALPVSEVPDVVGKTYPEAEDALVAAGASASAGDPTFEGGVVPENFPFDVDELAYSWWGGMEKSALLTKVGTPQMWTVSSQSVPAGTVFMGTESVTLTTVWPATTVPDLTGLNREAAQEALNAVGLAGHGIYGDGIARTQSFPPGTVLPMGSAVEAEVSHEVTFRVTGTGSRATVTWAAPGSFSIEQEGNATLPWSKSWYRLSAPDRYERGTFNAQVKSGSPEASITCEALIDGAVVESRTSTGAYAVVSCG